MQIIDPGYVYELEGFDPDVEENKSQIIQFIEKTIDETNPNGPLKTKTNGTTNEEVLAMLIDRVSFQDKRLPSTESKTVLTHLKESLTLLQKRTRDRKGRGVEGTMQK